MLKAFPGSEGHHFDALLHDIAKEVARITSMDLSPTTTNMNLSELRGYLRSRAAREAREQVSRCMAKVRLPWVNEAELIAAVLERAVHQVIRDLSTGPVTMLPMPHVQSRAA